MTAEQLTKLPKWAQEAITSLQRQRDNAQAELKRLLDSQTKSFIYVHSRTLNLDDRSYIQDDSVNFVIEGGEIEVFLDDGELKLMARGLNTQIAVIPSVTNVIRVRTIQ